MARPASTSAEAKVAALGLRVRRGCTFHGLAFNVAMDLEPFQRINPCGYQGLAVTQVLDLGGPSRLADVETVLIAELARQFGLVKLNFPHRLLPPFAGADATRTVVERTDMNVSVDKTIPIAVVVEGPLSQGSKQLGEDKIARNRAGFDAAVPMLRKPSWIRVRIPPGNAVAKLKAKLRENRLVTVCEEASCPNIHECFGKGTATFMILGEVCTRRCSFCDVAHGRPKPPDAAGTGASGRHHRRHGPALRGDHLGRPRRSARWRRQPFRRLHPRSPCRQSRHQASRS